ncbi:MAG TPA: hypothetical protein PKO15_10590 [Fibrobacteria bacterium]|nr:hypothetical protein [Fibrobacteria bacterium]HOX51798.1 hypothetical protein [Fibrobacteria bacterium]
MNTPSDPLESALRSLPPLTGVDDWPDLRDRLSRRRSIRSRLRLAAPTFRWVGACLAVLFAFGFWQALQGRRSVVASESGAELRTWVAAHQDAYASESMIDPWADPIEESSP